MAKKKIKVGILFGGKSAEHKVSLQSAKNVFEAMDKEKYEPVLIGVSKAGKWLLNSDSRFLLGGSNPKLVRHNRETSRNIALVPQSGGKITNLDSRQPDKGIDVIFPVLHGPFGEDGTVQGLLKLANVPFVGAGVLGSAVGMDKDAMKRLMREAGISTAKFLAARENNVPAFGDAVKNLGLPFFVKPANLGSSVGVSKVRSEEEFMPAVHRAFQYDRKILLEEYVEGREIECSVLGNDDPVASIPGEVILSSNHNFYSYEAKYIDERGAALEIPAKLPPAIVKKIQEIAVKTFKILGCEGMGRVDFFLKKDGAVVVNEINTIPGFTAISMYPKLWEASGVSYAQLIDKLIQLALERFEKEQKLKTSYEA